MIRASASIYFQLLLTPFITFLLIVIIPILTLSLFFHFLVIILFLLIAKFIFLTKFMFFSPPIFIFLYLFAFLLARHFNFLRFFMIYFL